MKYFRPSNLDEAATCLRSGGPDLRVLAGGTDLTVQMRSGRRQPGAVLDIKRIAGLSQIARGAAGGWSIGAAVCAAAITEHEGLCADWPGFVEGVGLIGSMQVQSRATPVGNLCNASPAADSVPAMIAADATASVLGREGMRLVPVADLITGPGQTVLAPGEIVTAINLPPRPARSGDAYLRLTPRAEMDIAVAGAAVNLTLDAEGRVRSARVALGAVAPRALLVPEAGAALVGTALDKDALARMAQAVAAACAPIDDKRGTAAYRIAVAPVLARRAAQAAHDRAQS